MELVMNDDWKGMKVDIVVRKRVRYGSTLIKELHQYLDTDTLVHLFEQYPPQDGYMYTFYPDNLKDED